MELKGDVALAATIGIGLFAAYAAAAFVQAKQPGLSTDAQFFFGAGIAPLIFATIVFADPRPRRWLRDLGSRAPIVVGLVPAVCLGLIEWATQRALNPFALVAVGAGGWAIAGLQNDASRRTAVIGPADVLALLALGIPLDCRWYQAHFQIKFEGDYEWFALAVTFVAIASWGALRDGPLFGHRPPKLKDLAVAGATLLGIGAVLIPAGLVTGFLKQPHLPEHDAFTIFLESLAILFTVALPEEVLFRGVIDSGLRATLARPWVSLVISSLLFGLWHWPRENKLDAQLAYFGFSAVAGVFYAFAHRKGEGLPAAVITHTVVDVVWAEVLHK